uniref:Glycoprotein n=1 Tax=Angiostrongylus cantonensis TaxID=6313 RepID=A0A0K0CVX8_ANGCA
MRTLHPATVVAILLVALVLNIYILVGMHKKECSIIEARNYGTVKEVTISDENPDTSGEHGSFATWTGVINFFSELHDVTPKALQPLHLSPTKSVHKKLYKRKHTYVRVLEYGCVAVNFGLESNEASARSPSVA